MTGVVRYSHIMIMKHGDTTPATWLVSDRQFRSVEEVIKFFQRNSYKELFKLGDSVRTFYFPFPHTCRCTLYVPVGPIQAPRNRPNPCPRPCHAGVGNHAGSNSAGVLTATSTPTASRLSRPLRVLHAAMGSTMRVDWLWSLHPVPVNADLQGFLSSQDADVERQVPLVWLWRLH